jgi:hypothetical protein
MRYDADKAPDPEEWLELDEQARIDAVSAYHRRNRLQVGQSAKAHAATHVIVENQAATGDVTAVPATLARLMREGLERHDAVHAIGSVLMGIIFDMSTKHRDFKAEEYGRALAVLTAENWRAQG